MSGKRAGGFVSAIPVDYTPPINGQVLTFNDATGMLEWVTPTAGLNVQEGTSGAGASVVNPATILNFASTYFDVQSPGGGEAFITLVSLLTSWFGSPIYEYITNPTAILVASTQLSAAFANPAAVIVST